MKNLTGCVMDGHIFTSSMIVFPFVQIGGKRTVFKGYSVVKWTEFEGKHSHVSCTQVYSERSFTSTPLICLHERRLLEMDTHFTSIYDWTVQQVRLL